MEREEKSMGQYCLGVGVIGPWPFVEISAEAFYNLKAVKDSIFVLLGIEEKFDMVIANYLEYERDVLDLALVWHHMTPLVVFARCNGQCCVR